MLKGKCKMFNVREKGKREIFNFRFPISYFVLTIDDFQFSIGFGCGKMGEARD